MGRRNRGGERGGGVGTWTKSFAIDLYTDEVEVRIKCARTAY